MIERVIARGPGEGRTLLVGGGDLVTYKARSAETGGAYFCFEVSTTPGFGPPLHTHAYRELFYVLEGEYEFTFEQDDRLERISGRAGTSVFENLHTVLEQAGATLDSVVSVAGERGSSAVHEAAARSRRLSVLLLRAMRRPERRVGRLRVRAARLRR
jgi:hypothetical protein